MLKEISVNNKQAIEDQSTKKLVKHVAKLAFPLALQGVLQSLVSLIDNLFLGNLNSATDIAAGVNAINNMTFIINTIVIGFMAGIGIYFAQAAGKKDLQYQKTLIIAKLFWTIVFSIILFLIITLFLKDIAKLWLPSSGDVSKSIKASNEYGKYIFPSQLISFISMIFASSFRERKKVIIVLIISSLAIIVNSALNYPFMYSMGMGIKGSAIATLIARSFELIVWVIFLTYKRAAFMPRINDFKKINWRDIFAVFKNSWWWMINNFILSFAFTLQIMFISRISIESAGALNAAGVFAQLANAFTNGYAVALGILMMHHISENSIKNIKRYMNKMKRISLVFGIIMGLMLISLSWIILFIYPKYTYNTRYQSMVMLWAIGSTIMWIQMVVNTYVSFLKGLGYSKSILLIDGIYSWLIVLPLTILLCLYTNDILNGGYIYWIVMASTIFKPLIIERFFKRKISINNWKPLLEEEKLWKK